MAKKRRLQSSHLFRVLLICVVVLIVGGTVNYLRPLPSITPKFATLTITSPATQPMAWPGTTEAAIGAVGYGVLATNSTQTPLPTASVAKLITSLAVLQKYPLSLGQQGPTMTLSANDVAIYQQYEAEQGSVVTVQAGEQLSEYQALQAMLLPSANNIADSLAIWAFGSLANYETAANQLLVTLGLANTHVGTDASGFLPTSTSTAHDLVQLGLDTLKNPVLAQIVAQPQATLPIVGTVYNVNRLLGSDGIIGIKTGNSDQAGGVYLFAADDVLDPSNTVTIVGAVVGDTDLDSAINAALPLLTSAQEGFTMATILPAGTTVATYKAPWATSITALSKGNLVAAAWSAIIPVPRINVQRIKAATVAGTTVGTLSVSSGNHTITAPVVLKTTLPKPTFWWRLTRHNL
jgi:D-alanyl-D-alanine carboxypeptidase (penicillin-binding protein 5/6)